MRIPMFILLLLFSLYTFSQNVKNISAEIEYRIVNNTGMPNSLNATLWVDGTSCIYLPKYTTKVYNDPEKTLKGTSKNAPKLTTDTGYTRIDHKKQEILFFDDIGRNEVLVKDSYNKLDWDISGETKDIEGYSCTKATTKFRGREWIVWFTPEIALPYGPWKLHGLPGLILEAAETTNTYSIHFQKIDFKRDPIFDKDFASLVETINKKPITYKQYLADKDEFMDNIWAETKQRNPGSVGEVIKGPRGGYELVFEWE